MEQISSYNASRQSAQSNSKYAAYKLFEVFNTHITINERMMPND